MYSIFCKVHFFFIPLILQAKLQHLIERSLRCTMYTMPFRLLKRLHYFHVMFVRKNGIRSEIKDGILLMK